MDAPLHGFHLHFIFTIYQEANLVEEVEDSPDFWSEPVQSYNSPVEHRARIQYPGLSLNLSPRPKIT